MILLALFFLLGDGLSWRAIGPFRGGRTKAAAAVPGRPGAFLVGAVNGGVWRTENFGRTWTPIFDDQPTGSIGALAAPTPDIIYVGSGEGLQRPDLSVGDGFYRSLDGGKSWQHLGLRGAQQIAQIAVDPRDPKRLFVAALGHPYGPNEERGLYRSLDGGENFERVLYRGPDVGAADVAIDPADPRVVYASLWESRQGPWEDGEYEGKDSGLYKSNDGGTTWRELRKGLPANFGRVGIGIAPSLPSRIFLTVEVGEEGVLYRSDDAGESFARASPDGRVADRPDDFAEVKVHPQNPDIVFTASVVVWKSVDGGKTFSAFRGSPGGDDYHRIVIDAARPDTMLVAGDQGAIITVDGGLSWSSWYNQPTAQMFHATADNAFPYRVCGGQQESGSACVSSRGADGHVTMRDWSPAGFEEYGYAAPDPLDPDIVFGGKLSRWNRRTGEAQDVTPRAVRLPGWRVLRTQPVVFSPADPHLLFFASERVWRTRDGGKSWTAISDDLSRKSWPLPATVLKYAPPVEQRGVVYALAPSPRDARLLWAGTDDGLMHLTRDGGRSWRDVTPPQLGPWMKVSVIEAGHFDAQTAYAAVNALRLDDLRPHIFRTHDGGAHWDEIVRGLPDSGPVNAVREDPVRKGLLFCGTEQAVFFSADDGASWLPLRLNMPATSVRDVIIKDGDLVAATHGRGFWILDDFEPLREEPPAGLHLYRPREALRVRWNTNHDTPLPPDEPWAQNPPDGAIIDYQLSESGPVTLEILDAAGKPVRKFATSEEPPFEPRDEGNVPRWWIRPPPRLDGSAGAHRFVWDLHDPEPAVLEPEFRLAAVPHDTPREPRGPWVLPGRYTVRLRAGGKTLEQPLLVKLDPRVKASPEALRKQLELSQKLVAGLRKSAEALDQLHKLPPSPALAALEKPQEKLQRNHAERPTLRRWNARLAALLVDLQDADAAPTRQQEEAAAATLRDVDGLIAQLGRLR